MIELRWLDKVRAEIGEPTCGFKLQYRETPVSYYGPEIPWRDVPIVKEKTQEKTLEEKLFEAGWEPHEDNFISKGFCKRLAKIAEEHFKEKGDKG